MNDEFSIRIADYALSERPTTELDCSPLRHALARRSPAGVVTMYSYRGVPFRSPFFKRLLSINGFKGSIGRVASAADNAAMESFHSPLQKNVFR